MLTLPKPGRPGYCICFPLEQGSPVIPSGIGLIESEVKLILQLTISRPSWPSVRYPFGAHDLIFLLSDNVFVLISLTRGQACNHMLLSHLRLLGSLMRYSKPAFTQGLVNVKRARPSFRLGVDSTRKHHFPCCCVLYNGVCLQKRCLVTHN
jgi:hypothetical protein